MNSETEYRHQLPKHYVSENGLAKHLPYTVQTLRKYRMAGETPAPLMTGELILYEVGPALVEWIKGEWSGWNGKKPGRPKNVAA